MYWDVSFAVGPRTDKRSNCFGTIFYNLPYLNNNQVQVHASGFKWLLVPSSSSPEETKGEKVDIETPVLKFDITFNA